MPPKYDTKDFVSSTCWRLRGKLDVPKERFITYPHCNRDADRTPVIGWAGWDHLQQAQAVAGYYERMRTNEGWSDDRLLPLLVASWNCCLGCSSGITRSTRNTAWV